MAEMKIITQKIERIEPHGNADKLEVAFTDTFDWPVIIGKGQFKIGDPVIHFPVDCVITEELEDILLGDSKLKLKNGRIRAAKIRGVVSYGILAPHKFLMGHYNPKMKDMDNLMGVFGCEKYEPPKNIESNGSQRQGKKTKKRANRNFTKYFDMNHLQNCKGIFNDDDVVVITEKLHGTLFRAGWVKRDTTTLWDRIKVKIRGIWDKEAEWEFVYGSRNVQLQTKPFKTTFYSDNVYAKMVDKYNIKNIPKNIVIYAEIVGPGIQKNYQYTEDHEMFVYDIKKDDKYIDFYEREAYVMSLLLKGVPILNISVFWKDIKNTIMDIFPCKSKLDPSQKVMEGIVVETKIEQINKFGRKKVKILNPEYLLNKTNTDFH